MENNVIFLCWHCRLPSLPLLQLLLPALNPAMDTALLPTPSLWATPFLAIPTLLQLVLRLLHLPLLPFRLLVLICTMLPPIVWDPPMVWPTMMLVMVAATETVMVTLIIAVMATATVTKQWSGAKTQNTALTSNKETEWGLITEIFYVFPFIFARFHYGAGILNVTIRHGIKKK